MKIFTMLGLLFIATVALADDAPHKLAYEQKDAVWVANIDGANIAGPKKISRGQAPDLSPDGSKLAFNTLQADGQPAHRQIAIADLATGNVTLLKDIPSDNCMQATWSPDGTKLLFYFYVKDEMRIGIINADGTGFRYVQESQPKYVSYWAATWAADGKSIFAEDMDSLYQLDLNAKVLKKWKVEKIVPKASMSGNTRLHASANGKTLLMDIEMDEMERKGWDGPADAIWTLDLATEKTTRLTAKTLYGWDCHWLTADSILFVSEEPGSETTCIYRMTVSGGGKDRKLLVKNAILPCAAP